MAWNKIGLCLVLLGGVLLYGAPSLASAQKCRDENARTRTEAHIFRGRLLLGACRNTIPASRWRSTNIRLRAVASSGTSSYDIVCSGKTGAAETVRVLYNADQVDLQTLVR